MSQKVKTFLMFEGDAEEAMNFYVSLFDDARIEEIVRYGPNEGGTEGSVMRASFWLGGQEIYCIDSPVKHEFTFTPATSLFVDCDDEAELDRLYDALSADGGVLMPLDRYPFSEKYTWVSDKFGVSWQLNLSSAS